MWNQLKILHHNIKEPSPIHVQIELTERCNHQCIFCHNHCKERKDSIPNFDFTGYRDFPLGRLKCLLEELKLAGTKAISFTGTGEPLIYTNLPEILELLCIFGIKYSITTNMDKKLSQEELELISKAEWVRCSINGYDNQSYKRMHGINNDNSFIRVMNNIKELHSLGGAKVNISYVISKGNEDGIVIATKLFKGISNSISFRHDAHTNRVEVNTYDKGVEEQLKQAKLHETEDYKVYTNQERLNEDLIINEDITCYIIDYLVFIAANGDMYPCCTTRWDKSYVYGNVLNSSFLDIWNKRNRKINMRYCPPCRHYLDNALLTDYHNTPEDDFI